MTTTANGCQQMNLDWWYRAQDQVVPANRAEFEVEYRWLNEAVELLAHVQWFVSGHPVTELRLQQLERNQTEHLAANVVVYLVNDAMGSLINAIRLLLFGAHPDAFALVRSAFEACCYAEYFALRPEKAEAYMELEDLLSQDPGLALRNHQRKRGLQFGPIRRELEARDGQDRGIFYARLCNFGSHPSPKRVGLRMGGRGGAVTAAVSRSTPEWSRTEWTRNCSGDLMAAAKYALGILFEHYPDWFEPEPSLNVRHTSLIAQYEALQ